MISTEEALQIINETMPPRDMHKLPLSECLGKTLAQDVLASRDQPPFDRVMMDGIAIDSSVENKFGYKVEGTQAAGEPQKILENQGGCFEVMTGAPLPENCDCVIPIENIEINDGVATLNADADTTPGKFVHGWGTDFSSGDLLIQHGTKLNATHIGIIASCGLEGVQVYKRKSIAIISTGDELVELGNDIQPHQIYLSNSYALSALFKSFGYEADSFHFKDNPDEIKEKIESLLSDYDRIVLSGGVSKGKFDFIPQILDELGVEKHFHRIAQRPGKPMWYGTYKNRVQIFALPGNPVSCLVCARRYIIQVEPNFIELEADFTFKPDLTYFKPVNLVNGKAKPVDFNTSGDFNALGKTRGFIEAPHDKTEFKKGETYPYFSWT